MGFFDRKNYSTRSENGLVYIFTNGEKTEKNYFESKKRCIRKANIHIYDYPVSPSQLVTEAIEYCKRNDIDLDKDQCWVVFDKDNFPDFDEAIVKAKGNRLGVAYSNSCFELWLYLHFHFLDTTLSNKDYIEKLAENLKSPYKKESEIFSLIKDKEKVAIKYATRLMSLYHSGSTPSTMNPSTTVHLLINTLNDL